MQAALDRGEEAEIPVPATPVMAMIVPFRGAQRIHLQQLRFGMLDQGGNYVRSMDDTRAIGRIESYSEHEEPQVVRAERVLKYIMWVAKPANVENPGLVRQVS